jgi:Protein of unknown function (DUF455)
VKSDTELLPVEPRAARLLRMDAARVFKRLFHLERALIVAAAAWVPDVARLESKAALARAAWESALTAHALRERVLELRYPDRSLDSGSDRPVVTVFEAALHAPSGAAVAHAMATVLLPAQRAAFADHLGASDDVADGPSQRFLTIALADKDRQQEDLNRVAEVELRLHPEARPAAERWAREIGARLDHAVATGAEVGGETVPPGRRFALRQDPARDERYFPCSFYWPDNFDPNYAYGDGFRLQLRAAVSHLNEVWAVEAAGAILVGLAGDLGWEFVYDAARWLYDESRHMLMGKQRLEWWGFDPASIPLGSYIYEACRDQETLYRLGMLAYFETKNIGKKRERAATFHTLGDATSARDMDFDWADEAIHAGYGRKWMRAALDAGGHNALAWPDVAKRCEELVAARVAAATEDEKRTLRRCSDALIAAARERIA